jgi:hypothetical protein
MTTPARDAALAEPEPGTGSPGAGTPHSPSPAAVDAGTLIAQLRQRVRVWMDSDQILPADGSALLAALDQARAGLAGGDSEGGTREAGHGTAARVGIERFVGQVQSLIDAGVLTSGDGQPSIEAATRVAASLRSAGGIDR